MARRLCFFSGSCILSRRFHLLGTIILTLFLSNCTEPVAETDAGTVDLDGYGGRLEKLIVGRLRDG